MSTFESWTVLVQSNESYWALSPVVHGDIALSINTNTKQQCNRPDSDNFLTGTISKHIWQVIKVHVIR